MPCLECWRLHLCARQSWIRSRSVWAGEWLMCANAVHVSSSKSSQIVALETGETGQVIQALQERRAQKGGRGLSRRWAIFNNVCGVKYCKVSGPSAQAHLHLRDQQNEPPRRAARVHHVDVRAPTCGLRLVSQGVCPMPSKPCRGRRWSNLGPCAHSQCRPQALQHKVVKVGVDVQLARRV